MKAIRIKITSFIDDHQPGYVECKFTDAWNVEHTVHEKVPIVTDKWLNGNSEYPQDGDIAFEVVRTWIDEKGRTIFTVNIGKPWGVETINGLREFDILEEQITELNQ